MKIAPTRQQLSSLAMVSILFGVAVTVVVGWIYWRFNGTLNDILSHDAQNDVRGFVKAFKALVFLMLPGFCACLLGLSLGVMLYLNEESSKAASPR